MELQLLIDKWDEIKDIVTKETETSVIAYNTWLKPLDIYDIIDGTLYIIYSEDSESRMIALIEKKYNLIIKNVIKDITGNDYNIKIILPNEALNLNSDKSIRTEKSINENDSSIINTQNYIDSNLIPIYTFDTFVVGKNNRFAQGTAYTVAEAPGEICNPLFICGGPGLGKTHLMHAIGNKIIENDTSKKVLYVTAEDFTNEIIECIKNSKSKSQNDMTYFRDKYRTADVLMIDDIQFFVDKEGSQEEFFNTYNKLYMSGKQIIISSDKLPKEMEGFDRRYITRFQQGIVAEVKIPDYETRVAITKNKIDNYNKKDEWTAVFAEDVIYYIANNFKGDVRDIEGAVNKLYQYSKLLKTDITIDEAVEQLEPLISPDKPKEITPQLIIEVVCEHYGVTIEQLISKNRSQNIIRPRHVAMYLCTQETNCSQDTIARLLDRKDHSTIINARNNIIDKLQTDYELKNQIDVIKKKLYSI